MILDKCRIQNEAGSGNQSRIGESQESCDIRSFHRISERIKFNFDLL